MGEREFRTARLRASTSRIPHTVEGPGDADKIYLRNSKAFEHFLTSMHNLIHSVHQQRALRAPAGPHGACAALEKDCQRAFQAPGRKRPEPQSMRALPWPVRQPEVVA